MAQQWCDLLFVHWSIPVAMMRKLVPPQLPLDLWGGRAWVGIVPFRMQGVRPRMSPAMPWLSAFPELNVRTYVTVRDRGVEKPGVYFFSLEAANPVAVTIARRIFKLPYFNAKMQLTADDQQIRYSSQRTHHNASAAEFIGTYAPIGPVFHSEPGSIDTWLTERYALYTMDRQADRQGRIYIGEIHHIKWPLQPATATIKSNTMAQASDLLLPDEQPLLHFARHLDVVVWPLRQVE